METCVETYIEEGVQHVAVYLRLAREHACSTYPTISREYLGEKSTAGSNMHADAVAPSHPTRIF